MAAALVAGVGAVGGCKATIGENGTNFTVVNGTAQAITVIGRVQRPGQPPDPQLPSNPVLILAPGEQGGMHLGLAPGLCKYWVLMAYDPSGKLVATDPSPICEDKHGHGATWTVQTK